MCKKCSVEGCNNKHKAKGYCVKHYRQMQRRGQIIDITKDKNEIIEYEDYAEVILYNQKKEEVARAMIDLEDVDKIKSYRWGFAQGYAYNGKCKLYLHRLVMDCPDDMVVDHINHNTLDNRKCNLRVCTQKQNSMNMSKQKINCSSQYKNIYWNKQISRWVVQITVNGKKKHIGSYTNEIEASIEADRAMLLYQGLYANLNHPLENYIDYIIDLGLNPNDFYIDTEEDAK